MNTISLCMIVKNEEDVLGRCLDSVADLMDEIIIVDTGSTDKTEHIARKYTDHVEHFKWVDDFAAARNFAFSKATMDYICWLDADDVMDEKNRERFLQLKETIPPETDVVMMRYEVAFDAQENPTMSYYRERLLRRKAGFAWTGAVHEVITPCGNIIYSEVAVQHRKMHAGDPNRNLQIYEKMLAEGNTLDARQQFYYARELFAHTRYTDAIAQLEDFLGSGRGWVENCIDACADLAWCYYHIGEEQKQLTSLLRSFVYDKPRAEICCRLGQYFKEHQKLQQAIYWYKAATNCAKQDKNGGFVYDDCYGFIPYLQLCVCYDLLGDHETAREYNEKAAQFKPQDKAVLHNRSYFDSLQTEK